MEFKAINFVPPLLSIITLVWGVFAYRFQALE